MENNIVLSDINQIATTFVKSKLFADAQSVDVAIVKIMAGMEFGLKPFQSMQSIDIIQGKIFIKPLLLAGLIKQSNKYDYRIIKSNIQECIIDFFENGEKIGQSIVTIEDCNRMGLTNKDNWKKQPQTMLYNRCMSQGARRYTPDLFLMPVYTEGDEYSNNSIIETSKTEQEETVIMITKQQRMDLKTVAENTGYGTVNLVKYFHQKFGVLKSADLTFEMYQDCIMEMEKMIIDANDESEYIAEVDKKELFKSPVMDSIYGTD